MRFILRHPLNRGRAPATLARFARWQVASRLAPGPLAVPFVGGTRLLVAPGMTGATGNVYCGLHEFEDMAFVLHALRPGDLFVDVGANVGSYSILAAGACGARVVALEPGPTAFARLLDNVRLNGLEGLVSAKPLAVGAGAGRVRLTADLDTLNHVVAEGEPAGPRLVDVALATLDSALGGARPALVKIDVEGYEADVLKGAAGVLASEELWAVLVETNGSGACYGTADRDVHAALQACGFSARGYDPFSRRFTDARGGPATSGNTLYLRDPARVAERLRTAPRYRVLDREL